MITPDKSHACGCVTFWDEKPRLTPTLMFRKACMIHSRYAQRIGVLVHAA